MVVERTITKIRKQPRQRPRTWKFNVYYDTAAGAKNRSITVEARDKDQARGFAEYHFSQLDERQAATDKYRAENPDTCMPKKGATHESGN